VEVLYGLLRGGWLEGLLAGIAVGMSMLPEEFPMVLAVFMAMGAWRISKAGVLTRCAATIESLGAASVLCTDKTGTLTENRMTSAELRLAGGDKLSIGSETILPDAFRELADARDLASAPQPFDPMGKAFHALATRGRCEGQAYPAAGLTLVRSYPLTPELLAMTQVWQDGGGGFLVAAKGAPEAIADLCRLDSAARGAVTTQVDLSMAA
jgi:Ca2+-transporting ATPase